MRDRPLEKTVEGEGSDYAIARGWYEVKIMKTSKRGFPDRYYVRAGRTILVEWKRPGEGPNPQQVKRHRELRAHGAEVFVIDNMETARAVFR